MLTMPLLGIVVQVGDGAPQPEHQPDTHGDRRYPAHEDGDADHPPPEQRGAIRDEDVQAAKQADPEAEHQQPPYEGAPELVPTSPPAPVESRVNTVSGTIRCQTRLPTVLTGGIGD